MTGTADFSGQKVNTLRIGAMVGRRPEPRYTGLCRVCKSSTTVTQSMIRSGTARCLSTSCGKDRLREHLNDSPRKMREREESEQRRIQREREERQAAELAEVEEQFKKTTNQIAETIRERLLTQKDDEFEIDPSTFKPLPSGVSAEDYNTQQVKLFLQENADYFPCQENLEAMTSYIQRNGPNLKLVSAVQWAWAYRRLSEYGILKPRPAPESFQRPQPVRINLEFEQRKPEQEKPTGSKIFIGRDPETGRDREYTSREIDRMSSKEYARTFPVAPTVAALLTAMEADRTR
jgi:hypothetical protein